LSAQVLDKSISSLLVDIIRVAGIRSDNSCNALPHKVSWKAL
jgi:hypothetical protein